MKAVCNARRSLLPILAIPGVVFAGAGSLDPSFGQGGIAFYGPSDTASCRREAAAIGIHPDGSIIFAGSEYDASGNQRIDAAKITPRGSVIHEGVIDLHETSSAQALAIDPEFGYTYVGANGVTIGYIIALNPDGTVNSSFGYTPFEANLDNTHQTRLNDIFFNSFGPLSDGAPIYVIGTYAGGGNVQIAMSRFGTDGGNPNATSIGIFVGDNIATSLGVNEVGGGTHLVAAGYASGQCFVAGLKPVYVSGADEWNFDLDDAYTNRSYSYTGTLACYTDTLHMFPDGYHIAAGRVINSDGSWSAYFQGLAEGGAAATPFRIFKMSNYGDNSLRKILVQSNGELIFVGFTGVDASNVPGAWVGRFHGDGTPDSSFGSNGSTLIDFDTQDYAYGQALSAALDRYGRVVLTGTQWTGTSDGAGNDCTRAFVARLQNDDLIFADGFEP
jgi:hypothetical protein